MLAPPPLGRYAVADAVERILPSVVKIRASVIREPRYRPGFGRGEPTEIGVSHGSGFIISSDGQILSCAHVVREVGGALQPGDRVELTVTLANGQSFKGAVEASDEMSDIAVLSIDPGEPLPAVKFANSSAVRAGEFVVAVGSPLTLENSCSFGIISCIQRDLEPSTGEDLAGLTYFQTDLAINAGSSGGPLVSLDGEVLGICSKKIEGGVEGIGFAIPIDYARKVVEELREHGSVRRPFLGLVLISLTPKVLADIQWDKNYSVPPWLQEELSNANTSTALGLLVHGVTKGGPGDRAGLRPGDVVVGVDQVPTRTTSEFLAAMSFKVQKEVAVQVRRAATGELDTAMVKPEALYNSLKNH